MSVAFLVKDMNGRKEIFTDARQIDESNIIGIVQKAMVIHEANVARMTYLLNYEEGIQPLHREKTYRPDINCEAVDNVANEITEFKLGYNWGFPITLVQRGERDKSHPLKDYDGELPPISPEAQAITILNECYDAENASAKTQQLGRFVEICGVGYTYTDVKRNWKEGDSYFQHDVLDSRFAFVVKSSYYVDKRVMLGVSYFIDELGQKHITAITDDYFYELDSLYRIKKDGTFKKDKDGNIIVDWSVNSNIVKNTLGVIPIVEYFRSYDRMGCFERQISEMDNLNLLISDFSNDVDQNTQAVWHTNDVELTEVVEDKDGNKVISERRPKSNEWVHTQTTPDGKTPFIKPLSIDYDYSGMLQNILSRRALILQKCYVPQRTENTNGATGIATGDATGWSAAETQACKQEMITNSCKKNELKVVLAAIKASTNVPADSPLNDIKYSDIEINIKRQRTYEMTSKINAYATGVSHGLSPEQMVRAINLFNDPQQVIEDSKPYFKKYLDSTFKEEEKPDSFKLSGDNSDQVENSPNMTV